MAVINLRRIQCFFEVVGVALNVPVHGIRAIKRFQIFSLFYPLLFHFWHVTLNALVRMAFAPSYVSPFNFTIWSVALSTSFYTP